MDFISHAKAYGLVIDRLISDGRWHRVPTVDKPRKRNGAYLYDGARGVVRNWATMENFSAWPEKGEKIAAVDPLKLERIRAENIRKQESQYKKTAILAEYHIKSAKLGKHEYLKKKGFKDELGLVLKEELIIPMRDFRTQRLMSLQRITTGGDKKFLMGGQTKGAVNVIGRSSRSRGKILCEGYATGLSIKSALDYIRQPYEVWVCFSASNMVYVSDKIGGNRYVVADHDASRTGQNAAESIGLPWVIPSAVGKDFNDLHQSEGLGACVKLLRDLLGKAGREADRVLEL